MTLVSKSFSEIVTFSRSSNATRVGPTGLVEYAPHNLALRSQEFDNASWTKTRSSVTANAIAAPDGTVTADKLVEDTTASDTHFIVQAIAMGGSVDSSRFPFSIFAKAGERNRIRMYDNNQDTSGDTTFNLSTGTVVTGAGTITSVGNGWYRCTIYPLKNFSTTSTVRILLDNGSTDTYTGDGTSGIYLWGAQLSVGPYALDYTPTTSAAVYGPRFDYDPVTLAARGLLVEESRTNLVTYSEQFDNAAWAGATTAGSVSANATTSPDGTVNADLFIPDTSSSATHRAIQFTSTSSGTFSVSVYAKAAGYSRFFVFAGGANQSALFDLTTQTVVADTRFAAAPSNMTITAIGNGWYRCSFSTNISAAVTNVQITVLNSTANPGDSWTGNGTSGIYIWGAQLEAGSFATSYIPTPTNSTVTRSADVASVNTLSPWFNATEGTLFAEFDFIGLNPASPGINQGVVCFTDEIGASNNLGLLAYGDGSASRYGFVFSGSSLVAFLSGSASSVNTTYKSALATKANDFRLVNSGGSVISDTSGAMPTGMNQLLLGNLYFTTNPTYQNGHLRRVAYYPRALTTAELQALTA